MQTHDYESDPTEPLRVTLSCAYDDRDAPTEFTIFDAQREVTTRWITIDRDHACELGERV